MVFKINTKIPDIKFCLKMSQVMLCVKGISALPGTGRISSLSGKKLKNINVTREYIIRNKDCEIQCDFVRKDCKRLRISVTPDLKVKITAPLNASDSFIHNAIREKTPWIIKTVQRLDNCLVLPIPENYVTDERLAYLGSEIRLKVVRGKKETPWLSGDALFVQLPKPDMKNVKKEVDKWYRLEAERIFGRYLKEGYSIVSKYGLREPFLKIRRMKSRWGSCGRSGKITLNLRLIHLPPVCIEYIVMHELCHLKYLNHSKDFYSFLQLMMPDWRERKRVLESYR